MKQWYEYPHITYAVAEWAVEQGEILTVGDVMRFFERPVKFSDWFVLWEADQAKQGELADESRYIGI